MSPKDRGDFGFHKGLEALGHVEAALGRPPTAIYANGGLHYLHLLPARDFECFQCWASAEFFLRRFVVESRRRYAGATLVFMTGHAICEDRYNRDYARLVDQLRNDPRGYAVSCVRALRPKFPMGMDQGRKRERNSQLQRLLTRPFPARFG